MIKTYSDLKKFINSDREYYNGFTEKCRIKMRLTGDHIVYIIRYMKYLRIEEYFHNKEKLILKPIELLYLYKKNRLGNKLGISIHANCFEEGLTVFHHGSIIINAGVRGGKYCKLHGCNSIGNNGTDTKSPILGDNVDVGFGAIIIGDIKLGNNIKIGANAVVVKTFAEDGITLVGVPAQKIH